MVLIVSQSLKDAVAVSHMFYYMKILSFPCIPSKALKEISTLYNAVIIIEPDNLPDSEDFVRKLRAQAPAPIFAVAQDPKNCKHAHVFDMVIRNAILSGNLVKLMYQHMRDNNLPYIGDYKYSGLNTSCTLKKPTYYFLDVDLTKTQRMILSYFVITNHEQQSIKNIAKYAFKYGKKPEASCIRSHISKINSAFEKLTTRKIIGCNPGTGYYILTPLNRDIITRKKDKTSHIVW